MATVRFHIHALCIAITIWLSAGSGYAQSDNTAHITAKADLIVQFHRTWLEDGRDLTYITPKIKQLRTTGDSGDQAALEAQIDDILFYFETHQRDRPPATDLFIDDRPVRVVDYQGDLMEAFISRDGEYLFFNSDSGGSTNKDIFYATRIDDYRFQFRGPVENANSNVVDGVPTMDQHGNFFFVSMANYRPGNLITAYRGKFNKGAVTDIEPLPEISRNEIGWVNMDLEISADGQTLYATQTYFEGDGPPQRSYFFHATKQGDRFIPAADSEEIFSALNADPIVYGATLSRDELEILYTRLTFNGSTPDFQTLVATRVSTHTAFSRPRVIDTISGFSEAPALTHNGALIYYHKRGADGRFTLRALHRRQ